MLGSADLLIRLSDSVKKKVRRGERNSVKREKACTGHDLVAALAEAKLPVEEAHAWNRDVDRARKVLKLLRRSK